MKDKVDLVRADGFRARLKLDLVKDYLQRTLDRVDDMFPEEVDKWKAQAMDDPKWNDFHPSNPCFDAFPDECAPAIDAAQGKDGGDEDA